MKKEKVELRNLVKRYDEVQAVNNISLKIYDGESIVLLGPSGCGKTTTLRLIAGLIYPDEGQILIEGQEVASKNTIVPPEKRELSMVFQSYAVWPHKTVSENVAYGLKLRGLNRSEVGEKVQNTLKLVKMSELGKRYPSELSGGQQQRVALARALALEPKILLLDEPLSNLDAGLRETMRFEIRHLQQRLGITTIYVTHDQEEAMVIADRLVVMNAGCIEQVGPPEEIYAHSRTKFVCSFIGLTNIISGSVEEIPPGQKRLVAKCGLGEKTLVSYLDWQQGNFKKGDSISCYIRPEDIAVSREKFGTGSDFNNVYKGKVRHSTFLGSLLDLRVRVGEISLRIQSDNLIRYIEGEEVYVYLNPERCFLLLDVACY